MNCSFLLSLLSARDIDDTPFLPCSAFPRAGLCPDLYFPASLCPAMVWYTAKKRLYCWVTCWSVRLPWIATKTPGSSWQKPRHTFPRQGEAMPVLPLPVCSQAAQFAHILVARVAADLLLSAIGQKALSLNVVFFPSLLFF